MRNSVYSVTQINKYIKNMFANDYMLTAFDIKGEVSNLKYHYSGHIYFTLKDEKCAIKCVMFSTYASSLKFTLKEGMQVIVSGNADVFERDGTYQIYAKAIRQDGTGNLFEEFEKLKQKLEEQGMFDPSYKRPIPRFVKTLGVVTAPTGAAVRDIIDVSKRRNPGIQIVLFPATVQGEGAPASIVEGIKTLEKYGVDVIICGRGGGSIEDLWGFNSEAVAQAIFDCSIPIISAVGHETDFTIADFVSDLRAPTPSAAAELAVCDIGSRLIELRNKKERLNTDIKRVVNNKRKEIAFFYEKIALLNPISRLKYRKEKVSLYKDSLNRYINTFIEKYRHRIAIDAGRLHGLSPLVKLSSGYSYVVASGGSPVKSVNDVKIGEALKINVTDGVIKAEVITTEGTDG